MGNNNGWICIYSKTLLTSCERMALNLLDQEHKENGRKLVKVFSGTEIPLGVAHYMYTGSDAPKSTHRAVEIAGRKAHIKGGGCPS